MKYLFSVDFAVSLRMKQCCIDFSHRRSQRPSRSGLVSYSSLKLRKKRQSEGHSDIYIHCWMDHLEGKRKRGFYMIHCSSCLLELLQASHCRTVRSEVVARQLVMCA